MRDDRGTVERVLKVEEALRLLEFRLREFRLGLNWLWQDIYNVAVTTPPGEGGTTDPCASYTVSGTVTTGGCSHTAYTPTYTATLYDSTPAVVSTWTATPGVANPVIVAGPGTYTLSVEVDNAHRAPRTFTASVTVATGECTRTVTTDTCYATTVGVGVVRGCNTLALSGATVAVSGDMTGGGSTDASGYYSGPYTGATDPPSVTFTVSGAGFVTQVVGPISGNCCHVGYGDVQLVVDTTNYVCGCDSNCGWPVKRTLTVTDAKGSATLTYGNVGGVNAWRGSHTYTEDEAGQIESIFDPLTGTVRDCCTKTSKSVTVHYTLQCDVTTPSQYRLSRSLAAMCFNLSGTPATRCAALFPSGGVRTDPRLTSYPTTTNWGSTNTYAFPCNGGVFNGTFNFTTPATYPPEAITGSATVTG